LLLFKKTQQIKKRKKIKRINKKERKKD